MIRILNKEHSIANSFLAELRDRKVQTDREKFRRNLVKLGQLMAYEISKSFNYQRQLVSTPLGDAELHLPIEKPVLTTVLRAGLPYFEGFTECFPMSDCGFIGAYRKEGEEQVTINLDYAATPNVEGKVVLVIDPMLATGKSFVKAVNTLVRNGAPSYIHVASLVAAPEGVKYLEDNLGLPHTIWTWALDEKLNERFYIVPGLGDVGDLCFGEKL
jgi:uracil phosphoribosyltransferase